MKKLIFALFTCFTLCGVNHGWAQTQKQPIEGAEATKSHYKALYYLDDSDAGRIAMTLRNMKSAMEDPRLAGKVEIELVVFGPGVAVYKKGSEYEGSLKELLSKGVDLRMCNNTMIHGNISRDSLYPFIKYVATGNGEIIIRGADGWVVIHP